MQSNNGPHPVELWIGKTENPVMPKRGPYEKRPKIEPPKWRRTFMMEWRKFRGMTQEELAEAVDMSPGQISDLEQGISGYSPESLGSGSV